MQLRQKAAKYPISVNGNYLGVWGPYTVYTNRDALPEYAESEIYKELLMNDNALKCENKS